MSKKRKKGGAPPHLSADARQTWREIVAEYDGWGVVELAILCSALEAYDRMKQAQKKLGKRLITEDKYGQVRVHPCVAIERDSRQAYLRALTPPRAATAIRVILKYWAHVESRVVDGASSPRRRIQV